MADCRMLPPNQAIPPCHQRQTNSCNSESAMSKLTLEPPSDSDATAAAPHLCVLLAAARPDLWPTLNAASLGRNDGGGGVDWPGVLRQMEVARQGEVTA